MRQMFRLCASLIAATMALAAGPVAAAEATQTAAASPRSLVEQAYGAFARGDAAMLAELLAVVRWAEAENSPYAAAQPYEGVGAVFQNVIGPIGAQWAGFAATPEVFIVDGDRVVALGRYTGVHNSTRERLNAQFAHIWTVTDGRIVAFQQYTDTAQWQAASTPD